MNSYLFIGGSPFSLVLFSTTVILVCVLSMRGAFKISAGFGKKFTVFLVLWVAVMSALVLSGLPKEHLIPVVPAMFALINICGLAIGFSAWGKQFATLPLWALAAFQSFRLPLEIVLHMWADTGTSPGTMTWTGQNFDIISGILAALCLVPALRNRKFIWFVNVTGVVLLLNVIRVVMMSSPFPFSWNLERPILLILYLPYAMIAYVCVWAAVAGHVILTRALLRSPADQPAWP